MGIDLIILSLSVLTFTTVPALLRLPAMLSLHESAQARLDGLVHRLHTQ